MKLSSICTIYLKVNLSVAQASLSAAHDYTASPTVTLRSGVLIGTTTSLPTATAPVNKFLGVPFAQSPPERFSPPKDPKPWSRPLTVTAVKPACIQQWADPEPGRSFYKKLWNNPGGPEPKESEDCLYLNVFAPSSPPPPEGRTVMVWWFGGALAWGDASDLWYDGSSFAVYQDVIIIAPNYRTNVFGFSNSPQIPLKDRNAGSWDHRKALAWVQANIQRFGGDPKKVTIFGWSAGGYVVDNLIQTFPQDPPFRAGIIESGIGTFAAFVKPGTSGAAWTNLTQALGCDKQTDVLQCVRAADAFHIRDIIEKQGAPFYPVVDGVTQIKDPVKAREARQVADVPFMLGNNAQEGRENLIFPPMPSVTELVATLVGKDTALQKEIAAQYSVSSSGFATQLDAVRAVWNDFAQTCAISYETNNSAANGYLTWRYWLNASFPNNEDPIPDGGAYHGTQIRLVHGTLLPNSTAQELALSQFMQGAWAGFAKNPYRGPGWNSVGSFNGVDLGVLGSNGGSGVTVVSPKEVDHRCGSWFKLYNTLHDYPSPT